MLLNLRGDIDVDMLDKLIEFSNEVNDEETNIIYFSSKGGICDIVPPMRDIIQQKQFRLVAYGEIYSSALDLFLTTNTPRTVMDETLVMYHGVRMTIEMNKKFQPIDLNKRLSEIYKNEVECNDLVMKIIGITEKDYKKCLKGEEFYYNHHELRNFLKNSEEYFDNLKN